MAKKPKVSTLDSFLPMAEIIDGINADFGENTIVVGDKASHVKVSHIPSGSAAIDLALGGGFPRNRISEIRGQYSSFKSTLAITAMAHFQQMYPEGWGAYIDLERTFDPAYAKAHGVNLSQMVVVNPSAGEESVDTTNRIMRADSDLFIVIDSIAAMVPSAEIEASVDQAQMALQARLVNRAMRIINARLKRGLYDNDSPATTVLALNQLRSKVGVVFGNPECLHGDTLVNLPGGGSVPIRDLVEQQKYSHVKSYDEKTQRFVSAKVSAYCHKGVVKDGDLMTVTARALDTSNGLASVTCTRTHWFLTQRGWVPAEKLKAKDCLVTQVKDPINRGVREFLIGAYVGDTTFSTSANRLGRSLKFSDHKNPEYVQWKVGLLSTAFKFSSLTDSRGYTSSASNRTYALERFHAQTGRKRHPALFFKEFSWKSLAIWYMDDGSLIKGRRASICVGRAKHSPTLRKFIQTSFKFCGLLGRWLPDNKYFAFDQPSSDLVFAKVAGFVPPPMHYKLPDSVSKSPTGLTCLLFVEEQTSELIPLVSVAPASARKYRDRNLYDLHVEGTANYMAGSVSNGVVVHNTTPGGLGKDFFFSVILRVNSTKGNSDIVDTTRGGISKKVNMSQTVGFEVLKNKAGGPQNEKGEFTYYYKDVRHNTPRSFGNEDALCHYGCYFEIIEVDGQGFLCFDKYKFKRAADLAGALSRDSKATAKLYSACMAQMRKEHSVLTLPSVKKSGGFKVSKPVEDDELELPEETE